MTQDAISADSVEEGGRDPRTVVLAGVLAAVVLGAGAYFFVNGGADEEVSAAPTITRTIAANDRDPFPAADPAADPAAAPATDPATDPAVMPAVMPAPATVAGGPNPFAVLYTAPVEEGSGSGSSGSGSSGSDGSGSGSGSSSSGSGSGSSGSGSSGSGSGSSIGSDSEGIILPTAPAEEATEPYVLELVSITPAGGDAARTTSWVVDGTPVASIFVGQRFGSYGELVVLALGTHADGGETVLLQVGDAAPRRIAVGEKGSVL